MTCEDEECVSVLVPVEFIAPCCQADEEGDEECVLDNIYEARREPGAGPRGGVRAAVGAVRAERPPEPAFAV